MSSRESVNFGVAHRALQKAADASPEWFDRARDVLKRTDDGSVLLMHALLEGLKAAYDAGRAGKEPPPLQYVQSIAEMQKKNKASDDETGPDMHPAAVARRSTRRPAPQPEPEQKPAPARRVSRGTK